MKTNILVVDDSALVRKYLKEIFADEPDLNVIDTAHDPLFAIEKIKKHDIDVITLDVEMPRMDGITFLKKLMQVKPIPTIILSSLTDKNAKLTIQALELGAYDVILKPENLSDLPTMKEDLILKVKGAASSGLKDKLKDSYKKSGELFTKTTPEKYQPITKNIKTTDKLIAIGSSTGGTVALTEVLSRLPYDIPGIVITQHMPQKFTKAFADRLNNNLPLHIKEAEDGDIVQNSFVYIAPGNIHLAVKASGAKYKLELKDGPPVNYHRPSVTVLFNSVANYVGQNAVGVMLTGMGDDGAKAMKSMKDNGSYNIVQDEKSSIVWGMPGKAYEYGAADTVLPVTDIAAEIVRFLNENK